MKSILGRSSCEIRFWTVGTSWNHCTISLSHLMSLGLSFLILNTPIEICPVSNLFFLSQILPVFRCLVKSEKTLYNKFVCMCMSKEFTNLLIWNFTNLPKLIRLVMKAQFLFNRLDHKKYPFLQLKYGQIIAISYSYT